MLKLNLSFKTMEAATNKFLTISDTMSIIKYPNKLWCGLMTDYHKNKFIITSSKTWLGYWIAI